jgi:hypothetical protein
MALDAASQKLILSGQVKVGLRHSIVAAVRDMLYKANVPANYSPADPFLFDKGLDAQVRFFQKQKGLTVDGIVGPKTWNALTGMATLDSSVRPVAPTVQPDKSKVGPVGPVGPTGGTAADSGSSGSDLPPATVFFLLLAGGFLIYRFFAGKKDASPALSGFAGPVERDALVRAKVDIRTGNCARARRTLRFIEPNLVDSFEKESFRDAVRLYRQRCEEPDWEIPEAGPRTKSQIQREDLEEIERQMRPRLPLKEGRPLNLKEEMLRREYLDLRNAIKETTEYIEALESRSEKLHPVEVKELVRLKADRDALMKLAREKRNELRMHRQRIDLESGLLRREGRPLSRAILKILKTSSTKKKRPSVIDIVATPRYVERETVEERKHFYPLLQPKTAVERRARMWIETRLKRRPTDVEFDEGKRRIVEITERRGRSPTPDEFERYFKPRGFLLPEKASKPKSKKS